MLRPNWRSWVNGKINAVKVTAETKSEADLLTFYTDNMGLTANW